MESTSSSSLLLPSSSGGQNPNNLTKRPSSSTGQRLSMTLGFNSSVKILNSKDQTSKYLVDIYTIVESMAQQQLAL